MSFSTYFRLSCLVGLLLLISACQTGKPIEKVPSVTFYQTEIKNWQLERFEDLKSTSGWLSLSGLFWLKEGENTFGSAPNNDFVFPAHAPNHIGTIMLNNGKVAVKLIDKVQLNQAPLSENNYSIQTDKSGDPTVMNLGTLTWHIIERENRFALRLKDAANPAIQKLKRLEYFPVDENWRIPARLQPAEKGKTVKLKNVVDMEVNMVLLGMLEFEIGETTYQLEAMKGGEDTYFIIFADATSGLETYGGGRYLYVPRADERNRTFIDFNKAYNPPCVFTDYATCPLPSEKNTLAVAINAGEKNYLSK